MNALLKKILKFFIAFLTISLLCLVAIVTLIDPNQFKNTLQEKFKAKTGRPLVIEGPIYWQLDPGFSIELLNLTISNPPLMPGEFLNVKKLRVEPKLWSLLSGKLLIDLQAEGLNAHLTRNMIGHSNWEDLKAQIFSEAPKFLLSNLHVQNASIEWQDAPSNQHLQLNELSFSFNNLILALAGFKAPLTVSFNFEDFNRQHSGKIELGGKVSFNSDLKSFQVTPLDLKANLEDLPLAHFKGHCQITRAEELAVQGQLETLAFSLPQWLSELKIHTPPLPALADIKAEFKYQYPYFELPSFKMSLGKNGLLEGAFKVNFKKGTSLKTLETEGTFQGKTLPLGGFWLQEFKTSLEAKEGIFRFYNASADFLNSHHEGEFELDVRSPPIRFSLLDKIKSSDVYSTLDSLGLPSILQGQLEASAHLNSQGNSVYECLQNVSGETHITITEGQFKGIQLHPLLQNAQLTVAQMTEGSSKSPSNISAVLTVALNEWRQQALNPSERFTPFKTLDLHLQAESGKLTTSDFKMSHPHYTVSGQGVWDLSQQTFDFVAAALLSQSAAPASPNLSTYLKETPLSIQIKGPLQNLSIKPDLGHYAEGALKLSQEAPLDRSTEESLEKLFGF